MRTRQVEPADLQYLLDLLPELTDFPLPERRDAEDLWQGDAVLLEGIVAGKYPDSFADVALGEDDTILGLIIVTLREELMSQTPSAHLEAIIVAPAGRGRGLGRKLLLHAEARAKGLGAKSMSLHVFSNNQRARALYDSAGYDSELIRAIHWFD